MEQSQQANGVALSCDLQGRIQQVISDDLGLTGKDSPGRHFTQLVHERDAGRAFEFLRAVHERGNVFDWEITARLGSNDQAVHFVGTQTTTNILIMGALTRTELIRFCWGLGKSRAIHAETLQSTLFGFALQPEAQKPRENYHPDEVFRLKNELAILQRDLARVKTEIDSREELFRGLFEQMAVGVCYSDINGKFIRFNRRFTDIIGYDQEELVGRHFREITHPDDMELDLVNLQELVEGKTASFSIEKRYLHKNGSIVWINLTVSKMINHEGEALHFISIIENITGRKLLERQLNEARKELDMRVMERTRDLEEVNRRLQVEIVERQQATDALKASEEKYRTLFETMAQGVMYVNNAGQVTGANHAAQKMLGLSLDQVEGRYVNNFSWRTLREDRSVFPLEESPSLVALKTGKVVEPTIMGVINPWDEQLRWLSVRAVPQFKNDQNKPYQVYVTLEDITERMLAEEMLEEKEEKYYQLFELGSDAVLLVDNTSLEIKEVNNGAEEMYGYSRDEFLSMKVTDLSAEVNETRKTVEKISRTSSERVIVMERLHRRKDGTILPVEISARNFTGLMKGQHVAAMRDISERKRAEEKMILQLERLKGLKEIDQAINTGKKIDMTLGLVLDQAIKQLGVDAGDILLFSTEDNSLVCKAVRGELAEPETVIKDNECAWQVVNTRRPVHCQDWGNGQGLPAGSFGDGERYASYWGYPLVVKGKVKGVLEVYNRIRLEPDSEWSVYLEALAGQAAIAVDQNDLLEGLKRANEDLITSYDETIAGWAKALELRHKETKGHADSVTFLAVHLAREIGMSEEDMVHFHRGVFLHDIGKMGIPDEILLKPAKLEPDEWEIMKQHPTIAWELLKDIPFLRPALDVPYCHHEKWDGSGYPRGLKGEDIPLGARIFAIVDVWDALMEPRPYRPDAWPEEKVRQYIREQSGKHFDPRLVDAFLKMLDVVLPEEGL
jgi:PAS domain S-box-containing protein